MAGSFNHLVGEDERFTVDTIDNLGDAIEALEECWQIIHRLSSGDEQMIAAICDELNIVNPWEVTPDESSKQSIKALNE